MHVHICFRRARTYCLRPIFAALPLAPFGRGRLCRIVAVPVQHTSIPNRTPCTEKLPAGTRNRNIKIISKYLKFGLLRKISLCFKETSLFSNDYLLPFLINKILFTVSFSFISYSRRQWLCSYMNTTMGKFCINLWILFFGAVDQQVTNGNKRHYQN